MSESEAQVSQAPRLHLSYEKVPLARSIVHDYLD